MKLGGYEILNELGRGGMGVVFRVRGPDGEDAALKLIVNAHPATFARFERERRLQGALGEEAGFVGLLASGRSTEGAWLVMPFMAGGTLRQKLEAGRLGLEETIALGLELATALGKAHALGIVHRDLKPENILFTASGKALVADLGLAKHFDRSGPGGHHSLSLTAQGVTKGTAGYMAPEQLEDAKNVGPPADVFALGAVLYECLGGRPAFPGDSAVEVLAKVSSGVVPALGRSDVPRWLEGALFTCLAANPRNRFPDGASLARVLREGRGAPRRSRLLPALALLLLVVSIVGAVFVLTRPAPAPRSSEVAPVPSSAHDDLPAHSEALPRGLRLAGTKVPAADGKEVELYLYRLPDGSTMEMVSVPAGEFFMGSGDRDAEGNERPLHRHAIARPCWIGRNDVTWGQYREFCKATLRSEPPKPVWWERVPGEKNDHPVVYVTWVDAEAYVEWAHLALPTEAEWEKAARGTDKRKWPWGNAWDPGTRCNFCDSSCPLDTLPGVNGKTLADTLKANGMTWDHEHADRFPYTSPVGSFPRGASPCGALDMAGNVWQWCEDWFDEDAYDRYSEGDFAPPASGTMRVARGACWQFDAVGCRSSVRIRHAPDVRYDALGFRVALR